jgi:hypothetical protein
VPGLENLSAFEPVKQTVFPVTPEEGNIIWRLVEEGSLEAAEAAPGSNFPRLS